MMDTWELEAREQIRDLVARYNANGDSGRFDGVTDLFWPDAAMELRHADGPQEFRGIDAIRSIFTNAADQWRPTNDADVSGNSGDSGHADVSGTVSGTVSGHHVRHHVSTLVIDLESTDRARGYCYFQVLMPHGLDHWGRYFDEYERRDGTWKFARRKVIREGLIGQVPLPDR